MDEDQIWAQLDLRAKNICNTLELVLEGGSSEDEDSIGDAPVGDDEDERLKAMLEAMESGKDIDINALRDDIDMDDPLFDEDAYMDESGEEEDIEEESSESGDAEDLDEGVMDLRDPSSGEESGEDDSHDLLRSHKPKRRKHKGHAELNDGFFDLASFNAETERAEAKSSSRGHLGAEEDSDSDMSVDLFAPVDREENFDEEDLENPGGMCSHMVYFMCFEPAFQRHYIAISLNPLHVK